MTEDELLLPFEDEHFHGSLREYFSGKRGASFNTIKAFPEIWKAFGMLDGLWTRSLGHIGSQSDQTRILPALLFFNAHARIRIAFELAFSRCLPEALGTLRSATEAAAFGYQFFVNPYNSPKLRVSSSTTGSMHDEFQENKKSTREMKQEFKKRKKTLYEPASLLRELEKIRDGCSQKGAHLTFESLATRVSRPASNQLYFPYNDAPKESVQTVLALILDCGYQMHVVMFKAFEDRLKLDTELPRLCGDLLALRGQVVEQLKGTLRNELERRRF